MNPTLLRLRAEVASDLQQFVARLAELEALPPLSSGPGPTAQAAVALHHAYGALESAFVRIARTIDGETPSGADWHQELLASMALDIEGVRPALLSSTSLAALRRLLGFRHFFRHAYGVPLDPFRVDEVRAAAIGSRGAVVADFSKLDDLLRALAASS